MFYRNTRDVSPTGGDVDITDPVAAFRVGGTGDLVVQMSKDEPNTPVTFKNVQAGEILYLRCKKIIQAGTTATNIIALW